MKDAIAVYKVALEKVQSEILAKGFSNTDQRRKAYKDELVKIASSNRQTRATRIARKALKDVTYLRLDKDGSK